VLTVADAASAKNKKVFDDEKISDKVYLREDEAGAAAGGPYKVRAVETCLLG
jgi:hypothetical protein